MNLYRRILTVSLAFAVVAASAICFSQAVKKEKEIYNESADAHAEIREALEKATAEHKRVILVFGANWCYDCHVLDAAFHGSDLAPILAANYEVVHVDIGKGDKNQDLMTNYEVPLKRSALSCSKGGKELCSIVGVNVFKDPKDGMKQFAGDC